MVNNNSDTPPPPKKKDDWEQKQKKLQYSAEYSPDTEWSQRKQPE
jgi:hypothetical protein